MHGLCSNGVVSTTMTTAAEWLRSAPRGAYTTARTVKRSKVFDLDFHIERLAESATLMSKNAGCPAPPAQLTNSTQLRPLVLNTVSSAIASLSENKPDANNELKLTILSHWEDGVPHVDAHVAPLPPRPVAPVKVKVQGLPRQSATAKDSEWVRQRQALEDSMPSDVNEILLASPDGDLLEGMSSNFFAIVDGKLCTAGDGILLGTVRDLVIKQCIDHGVEVELRPPRITEIDRWDGCLISSTSRLALPVDQVIVDDGLAQDRTSTGLDEGYHFDNSDSLASQIDLWVTAAIESRSQPLSPSPEA